MAIKIQIADASIEVNTSDELKMVINTLRDIDSYKSSEIIEPEHKQTKYTVRPDDLTEHDYASFYKFLGESKQSQFLRVLREKPEGLTDTELRVRLNLKTNNELAGTVSGLVKNAKKMGFRKNEIIRKENIVGNGKRSYRYCLTKKMQEVVPGTLI